MLLDLIALGLLILFVIIGAWRGALASGSGLVSLVVAYIVAVLAAQNFGGVVADRTGMPAMFAPIVAGSLGFAFAFLICALVTTFLKIWERGRRGDDPRSAADRLVGGLFGAVRGGLIVLLLSILMTWLDAARDLGVLSGLESTPDTQDSQVGRATGLILEQIVESAMSDSASGADPAVRMVARIAARPGPTLDSMQGLLDDEKFQRLQGDKLFWVAVENGAGERAINQASFYEIVHDPNLRARLADLGLVDADAAEDPEAFREDMAVMLSELGPRIKGLRNDPELQALARNPEIIAMLESGNTLGLVTHPDFRRVVARVSAQPSR